MSHSDYPTFPKKNHREQRGFREKRGAYKFEKTREYSLAEKWFEERKALNKEPIPVPSPVKLPSPKATVVKKAPPGLVQQIQPLQQQPLQQQPLQHQVKTQQRQRLDSCDLYLKIPSYNDFDYVDPDEIVIAQQMTFNLSNISGEAHFALQEQYSTPLVIEENLYDSYEGQLSEFEAQEALQISLALQEMQNQLVAYQMYNLLMLMSNTVNM
jgi:hypothetical protein